MELLALGEVISWPTPIFTAFSWTFAVKIWSQDKNGCCLKQKTTISQKFPHNFILSPKKAFIAKLSCVLVKMLRFQCYEWAHKSLSQPYRGDQWLSVTKGPKEMQKKVCRVTARNSSHPVLFGSQNAQSVAVTDTPHLASSRYRQARFKVNGTLPSHLFWILLKWISLIGDWFFDS